MTDSAPQSGWRRITFRILMVIFALSFIVSTVAVWANYRIQDSDAWAETVAPLASDPAIQARIVDQTAMLIENQMRADDEAGLLRNITINQAMPLIRILLNDFVESSAFAEFWENANYLAHRSLVVVIDGGEGDLIKTDGQSLVLDMQPVIDWLNPQLNEVLPGSNYTLNLTPDRTTIVLYDSEGIERLVKTFNLVDTLAFVTPIVMVVSLLGAVLFATNRKAALGQLGLTLTITAAIVLAVIIIAKVFIINSQPVAGRDALDAILRIVLIDLVRAFRVAAIVGLITYGIVALTQSRYAREHQVWTWLSQYREALAGVGIGLATLYLVISDTPTLWLAVLCMVVIIGCAIALIIWRRHGTEPVPVIQPETDA